MSGKTINLTMRTTAIDTSDILMVCTYHLMQLISDHIDCSQWLARALAFVSISFLMMESIHSLSITFSFNGLYL